MVIKTLTSNRIKGFHALIFVVFHLPPQSVSALVQPLGVCAEYLNPNIVQVSSHGHIDACDYIMQYDCSLLQLFWSFAAFTNNVCSASSQCWIRSSTKWSHLCRTWRKRTLRTRCRSSFLTLVWKRCFFFSPRQMSWPHSFLILLLSCQRLVSIPDLLSAIKLLCMRFQRELVAVVDDLRLDTLLRMLKTPHFSTKMNSLKEVGHEPS